MSTKKTTTDYEALLARLDRHAELEVELAALKGELSDATVKRNAASNKMPGVRKEILGYEGGDPKRVGHLHEQAQAKLSRLQDEHNAWKKTVSELTVRRAEIEEELSASDGETIIEVVHTHFKAVEEARASVERLSALIGEREGQVQAAREIDNPITAMEQERQELLADIAMGEAKESDLKALEAKMAKAGSGLEQELASREVIVDREGQTVAALRRRLAEAEAKVKRLEALTPGVVGQYIKSRTACYAGEYLELATKAGDALKRLIASDQILGKVIPRLGGYFLPHRIHQTFFPAPRLEKDTGNPAATPAPLLTDQDLKVGSTSSEAFYQEMAKLQAEGVPVL